MNFFNVLMPGIIDLKKGNSPIPETNYLFGIFSAFFCSVYMFKSTILCMLDRYICRKLIAQSKFSYVGFGFFGVI